MRIIRLAMCVGVVLAVTSTCQAFDGMRRGFVLGGGLGVAPSMHWSVDGTGDFFENQDESKVGFASNFLIGYGWNEQNLLVFEGNGAATTYDAGGPDVTITQGFGGIGWYHYFQPVAPAFFSVAGLGFYSFAFDIEDGEEDSNDGGLGLMGGVGYEFARHWQVSFVVNGGETSRGSLDFSHSNIEVLVGGVAF